MEARGLKTSGLFYFKRYHLIMIGTKFNRLLVFKRAGSTKWGHAIYDCICDCGTKKQVSAAHLRRTKRPTQSCGCLNKEIITKHGHADTRGNNRSPTYRTWDGMVQRTTNPNSNRWPDYGARGIKLCDRWRKFDNFLADMGERPYGTSIDRIDVNGNYEPGNCRWADASTQNLNKRKAA